MLSKIFGHKAPSPTCPKCGAALFGDEVFCTSCGALLQQMSAPAVPAQGQAAEASAVDTPAGEICSHCGAQIYPGDVFCVMCGAPIASQSVTAPATPQPTSAQHELTSSKSYQSKESRSLLTGVLVPSADVSMDDDPTVRPKLMRLPRTMVRTGGVRQIRLDGCIYDVQVPAGVNGDSQLRIPGLGYYDDRTGVRGDLLIGFHIVDSDD